MQTVWTAVCNMNTARHTSTDPVKLGRLAIVPVEMLQDNLGKSEQKKKKKEGVRRFREGRDERIGA